MPCLKIAATETNDDGRDDTPFALLYIEAVMLFPSNDAKRQAFLESAIADLFLDVLKNDDCGDDSLPGGLVSWALNVAPSFSELYGKALQPSAHTPAKAGDGGSIHGGVIAAYLILIPLVMHFRYSKSVGRVAAYRVLTEWLGVRNRLVGANKRSLKGIWDRYQSVSHLWAAFVLSNKKLPVSADALLDFLSLAELTRHWAEQYCPKHSREPLLDGRITWTVPATFPLVGIEYDLGYVTMPNEWVRLAATTN